MRTATRDYTTTYGRARIAVTEQPDKQTARATIVVHETGKQYTELHGHELQGAGLLREPLLLTIEQASALRDLLNGAIHAALMDVADIQLGNPLRFDHPRPATCAQVAVSLDPEQSSDDSKQP